MSPQDQAELRGDLRTNPLAELLVEVSNARLSGSLRIAKGDRKSIIYLKNGTVLFAVSNAREHRLFSLLIIQKKAGADALKQFANPANDHELATWLKNENILPAADVNFTIIRQIETVISDGLAWQSGEWTFDPLTRARDGMKVAVDIPKLVMEHVRGLPEEVIDRRFRPKAEVFTPVAGREQKVTLQPPEKFILERLRGQAMTTDQILADCPIPRGESLRCLYLLWLAGLLERNSAPVALSPESIEAVKSTKYSIAAKSEMSSDNKQGDISIFADKRTAAERDSAKSGQKDAPGLDLKVFLDRVDKASNLYETLGVMKTASAEQIKQAYLTHAKSFHPDKFFRETPDMLRRIHHAFSEIARAHETLKTDGSRATYDLKLRKEAETRKSVASVAVGENETQAGVDNFEQGLAALSEDNYAEAATHFSRAVHSCPQSARFHAYFGKALSAAEQYEHKAETEFQTAVRIAPRDAEIRMLYIDFLIELDMTKRAEGELTRFLEIVPNNQEAAVRLAKLGK